MLPIKKIVLYKHGVGYFERAGDVDDDVTIELLFRASEMNDVLKSLTVLDLSGGLISSISYESTEPLEKQLDEIAISLPEKNALTGFLAQVKGAQVAVEVGGVVVKGAVVGTESTSRESNGEKTWTRSLILLVDGASLRAFDFQDVKQVTFSDASLKRDLQHLLDTLIASKKKDLKRLTIFARGEGRRSIVASYVVETPVWKTSYRILLPSGSDESPLIQGWALVDNTRDEDWDDVKLTLVAGLPVSFVHDLYSPRYKKRPVVEVKEEEAYAPPVLEGAVEVSARALGAPGARGAGPELQAATPRAPRPAPMPMAGAPPPPASREGISKRRGWGRGEGVPVHTRTAEVGDLFQYEIANEVTVKRNQSALVPILQSSFEGKRVAVFNQEVREANPLSAVLLKNTTKMTLEGGAVTVLEGETYVGETMLETVKPDEERLLPFSVELGIRVSVEEDNTAEEVHQVKIIDGSLHLIRYRLEHTTYSVRNKLDRPVDLFLEHRFIKGWELVGDPEPVERTENFYRFRLEVPPGETTQFSLVEKGDERETIQLRNVPHDRVELWVQRRYIDEETRRVLEKVIEINSKTTKLKFLIDDSEKKEHQIFDNQKRLRENLGALGASAGEKDLRERYVRELTAEEDQLKSIRSHIDGWKKERDTLQREGNDIVRALKLERKVMA